MRISVTEVKVSTNSVVATVRPVSNNNGVRVVKVYEIVPNFHGTACVLKLEAVILFVSSVSVFVGFCVSLAMVSKNPTATIIDTVNNGSVRLEITETPTEEHGFYAIMTTFLTVPNPYAQRLTVGG